MYVNYHKHDHISNIILADSVATMEDYAKRAVELNQTVLSSCNHGTQGNYWECAELAEKYGLKWRYVTEAYFVKDRFEKDKSNCHLILAAKTRKGVGDLNYALSEANITGYYYRPRVDLELLMALDPKDVFVTTACVGGIWKYGAEEAERLVALLNDHFRGSFMLEVQAHNVEKQKDVNRLVLDLYRKYNIPLIAATDSHFIYPEDSKLRDQLLESHHLKYEDEEGWDMDYPSEKHLQDRFKAQGVLSVAQINEAMENTNVFLDFEDVAFDKRRKLPPAYPDMTQEERNQKYLGLVHEAWDRYKAEVPQERWPEYEEAIRYETDAVTGTNTSDYFLIDNRIVDTAKREGGILTQSGRGSGVSFLTNMLLGFSSVDRLKMPVTMYPDRFISKERLSTGQMPDLDLNCGNVEVFERAQAEVMGEWHSAQMVAFGTLKRLSAWKMYCRSTNVAFETANAISDSLKKYELDVKYAEDDEDREAIDPFDYVPKEYHEQLRMSNKYLGMVDSISPSPCSYLLTDQDIRREIGLYRINSKTGKKGTIYAAFIDGATADRYGYLKNDLLTVSVVNINAAAYKAAKILLPSVNELLAMCPPDDPVWGMYAKGYTMGLNQVEREKATEKVARYKPRNITELAAFVAAIRPGFKSMIDTFLARKHFDYGIPSLDNLLQTKEIPDSFLMFQEQIMKVLQHGGFTGAESYAAIKAISKKHPEKVLALKEKFRATFSQRIVEEEHVSEAEALATTDKIWQIINDSCSYLFNASHATCVALDSLYGAWLKAHYPYQYYTTLLRAYAAKKDKDRIAKAKEEMRRAFGIRVVACKFGQDNRDFFIDENAHTIADALTSVKHISKKVADALYKMRDTLYLYFVDLLYDMDMSPAFDATSITALIKMGYFSDFGGSAKLLRLFQEFKSGENRFYKNLVEKTQQKRLAALRDLESALPDEELPMEEIIPFECDYFGAPLSVYPEKKGCYAVIDVDDKYSPKLKLYSVSTGDTGVMKIRKPAFAKDPVKAGDVIKLLGWQKKPAYQYLDGKRSIKPGVTEIWMEGYKKISVSPVKSEKAS